MARTKKTSGDTTVVNKPAMTTKSAVEKKNQSVSPNTKKKITLDQLPVYDPGSEKDNDIFVDNIFDTDDYEDL